MAPVRSRSLWVWLAGLSPAALIGATVLRYPPMTGALVGACIRMAWACAWSTQVLPGFRGARAQALPPCVVLHPTADTVAAWGHDHRAPEWVNALEDRLTTNGPWRAGPDRGV